MSKHDLIREAFENDAGVEVIPRDKKYEQRGDDDEKLVGPYCRVSTLQESQEDSLSMQQAYYTEYVNKHPNWKLVDIYADHGISATSMKNRADFNRLIEDCKAGKVNLIITKAVARFARNTVDCVATCRMLKNLTPPVEVRFETEGLNTLAPNSELYLTFMAALAQGESDAKSLSLKWAIRSRFAKGIPKITNLYGFDRTGIELKFNKDIEMVKQMYQWVADGESVAGVRDRLNAMGVRYPLGLDTWSYSSVYYILTNEKYAGDVIMQKTIATDLYEHKVIKNTGQELKYRLRGRYEAAVPNDMWTYVQRQIGGLSLEEILEQDQIYDAGPWHGLRALTWSPKEGRKDVQRQRLET